MATCARILRAQLHAQKGEEEMRCSDIVEVLPKLGIHPRLLWECSATGCNNRQEVQEMVAFPGHARGEEQTRLFFFCSFTCYMQALPTEAWWRC